MSALYNCSPSPQLGSGPQSSIHHQQQQQYCLKWNNHTNNMVKVFNELLGDENFVDVTLACDGVSIKAHKLVLSACSSYFRDLFINNPCKHPIVILKDIHYEDLQAIIHFMYSGEVNVSYTQLGPLLKTAEALKVKGLTDVNEKHGNSFFNGSMPTAATSASDIGSFANGTPANDPMASFYNRMALESLTNQAIAASEPSNAYLAFMAQRFKKRRRKHKNGSALALANVLNANGGAFNSSAAAGATNGFSSPNSKQRQHSPSNKSAKSMANHHMDKNNHSNGNGNVHQEPDEAAAQENAAQDSGDESMSMSPLKRLKESAESSDSFTHEGARSPPNALNTQDDDDDEVNGPAANGDAGSNADNENGDSMAQDSLMMPMNDSDDEFYPDVKPIVSLDESPSPTNSTMDDNSSFNSSSFAAAVGPILENSLTGSNMPNNSTKVCVCHLCHLTFTAYSSLRRHMTRHYADRERYECDICLKSYSRKDYLKEHKKLKHSDVAKVMSSQRNKQVSAQANSVS